MVAGEGELRPAGVDRETRERVAQYGVERMLDELHAALRAGTDLAHASAECSRK